jgi:hypothetical protein
MTRMFAVMIYRYAIRTSSLDKAWAISQTRIGRSLLFDYQTETTFMGVSGSFYCEQCGTMFPASSGGGLRFDKFRCNECDRTEDVPSGWPRPEDSISNVAEETIRSCVKCGGIMNQGLKPMCPTCKSRQTKLAKTWISYD